MDGVIPGGRNESHQTLEGPIGKFQCDHRKKKERVKATRICREVGLSTVCIGYNGGAGTPVVSPMAPGRAIVCCVWEGGGERDRGFKVSREDKLHLERKPADGGGVYIAM